MLFELNAIILFISLLNESAYLKVSIKLYGERE